MPHSQHTSRLFSSIQEDINSLFKVIPAFVMTLTPNGRVQAANEIACQFMQLPVDEILDRPFEQLWPEQPEVIREQVGLALTLRISTSFEARRGGQVTLIYLYPIEHGTAISSIIAFGLDVTDRLAAKEQIRDLTLQIEQKVHERTLELAKINEQLREEKRRSDLLAYFSQILLKTNTNYMPLLRAIAEDVAELIGEMVAILLFSPDMQSMELAALSHPNLAIDARKENYYGKRLHFHESGFLRQALQKANYKLRNVSFEQMSAMTNPVFREMINPDGYKTVLAIPLVTGLQALGILVVARVNREDDYSEDETAFLNSLTSTIALALQNHRLFEELRQSQARVRGVSQQLVQNQEMQFRHLAREMHDQVGQDMTAININLALMRNSLAKNAPDALAGRMDETIQLVEGAVEHIRSIMAEFRPPVLDAYGLTAALYWYAEQYQRRTSIDVVINDRGLLDMRMASQVEIGLFRIAQEGLNNAAKHSQATRIEINLSHVSNKVIMEIKDNGVGFDTKKRRADGSAHWGMAIMRERAEAMEGKFHISSKPGQGVVLVVEVPETKQDENTRFPG